MVTKKAYGLLQMKVVHWSNEDVLTTSVENAKDYFFITDETNWNGGGNP